MNAKKIGMMVLVVLVAVTATGCGLPVAANTSQAAATPEETLITPEMTPEMTPEATLMATPTEVPTPTETETPSPTPTPVQPLTVTEGKLVYSNADVSVNVVYPVISGMADVVVQGNINSGVLSYLQGQAQEVESDASAATGLHGTYTFSANYEVMRNDGVILSIFIRMSSYTGGANVGSDVAFINIINTNPAQQPRLEQLFLDGTDYATAINGAINAQIAADPDEDVYDFNGVSATQGYYLTDTALVIVFPRYSILPGAYGEPEFSIPLSDLSNILIPEVL